MSLRAFMVKEGRVNLSLRAFMVKEGRVNLSLRTFMVYTCKGGTCQFESTGFHGIYM